MKTDEKIERILDDVDNWPMDLLIGYIREDLQNVMNNESESEIDSRYYFTFEGE